MSVDLVINSSASEATIALLEDKRLIELHKEKSNNNYAVGDIFLARIKKVMPGLNAAFVDVGYKKDAFLHYLDLGTNFASQNKFVQGIIKKKQNTAKLNNFKFEPEINKDGKIDEQLSANQYILVQIAKEPISTKGPRLSSELSIGSIYGSSSFFREDLSFSKDSK